MKMHLKDVAQNFNISHFIIYCCLLVLSVLLSLRVEGVILWSYGVIFLPLWVWKTLTLIGTVVGVGVWVKKKRQRKDRESKTYFIAMIQSSLLQFIIFVEEILIAINLDLNGRLSWSAIFTPLYSLSVLSVIACIFSCCIKRCNVELEVLGFTNVLQLIFLGLRLDGTITWRWAVVLIPTWILLILTCVCIVFYTCLQCCLLSTEENKQVAELRRPLVTTTVITFSLATISFTIFLALLVSQLDGNLSALYTAIFIPLHISILCLFPTTFTRQPANPLWFGLHKNFLEVVLELCPLFKEYLNVSWSKNADEAGKLSEVTAKIKKKDYTVNAISVILESKDYFYEDIMTPD